MKLNRDGRARKARARIPATAAAAALRKSFPIVGVGGSAGGLEAFTQLLQHLPVDTGMAFILVQHLDPEHASSLPHILSRVTAMPVREAAQGMVVAPNEVYVIPPNSTLRLSRGRLDLTPRELSRNPHLSIDFFFKSLAQERHEGAIGVVFSGNATDGTLGLEAIKAAGGITFAQDKTARYDSMPRSAIASGCVDYVMDPAEVALELARIATHPYLRGDLVPLPADLGAAREAAVSATTPAALAAPGAPGARGRSTIPLQGFAKILALAREQSGVDFTFYKTSTIYRRITRRMVLGRKNSLDDYAHFVATDAKEFKELFADLLISVTSFFRDEAAFEALRKIVFAKLVGEKRSGPVRFWSIGCSSGQEAYSLGMAFMEATEGLADRAPRLQIFGTDLNETLLTKARHGLYPKSLAEEISPERLRRFFVEEDGGYRVIKALREVCIFARQDLLGDPPFSRMDLVTCRNVLIYLEPAAQKRILPMLHYALKPEGFLVLGSSESIGPFTDLFEPVEKKQKIFARKSTTTPVFSIPFRDRRLPASPTRGPRPPAVDEVLRTELHAQQEADRIMVNLFAPPGVLVDAALNILQFHGATEAYLTAPSGKASFQLLKMAREGLMLPLRAAINQARKLNEPVRREKVRLGGRPARAIDVRVIPLRNLRERYFLILFETPGGGAPVPPAVPEPALRGGDPALRRRNIALERELRETRDYLQSLQQQHDIANDELQASNEEVQSTNEELQSINEELETSKEELESGNEELVTVNEEMAYRNGELSRLNSDLNNFHVSISTPIVVLGRDLTIRRFTPLAEKLFNLLTTDIGRPIGGIKHNLEFDDLEGFVRKVIDLLAAREVEVRDRDGRWYLLRARPYLTVDNKIDGAVLVLLDIDALKRSEQVITQERNYAEATLRTARDPLVILRPDLTVNTANEAFYRTFELTPAQTENRMLYELADGAWNIPALRALLVDVLPRNHFFNDLEVTHHFGGLGPRTMLLNGRRLESEEGAPLRILLSIEDVTERRRSSAALRASEVRYRRLFEAAKDGVIIIDPKTRRITEVNPFMVQLLGYRRDEFLGRELFEIGLFRDEPAAQQAFLDLREKQEIRYEHLPLKGKDGVPHAVEVVANLYDEDGRSVIQCNVRDITERKRLVDALRASETRYRSLFDSIDEGFCIIEVLFDTKGKAVDYRFETVNPSFEKQSGLRSAVGKRMLELAPAHEARWFEIYGQVASTGKPLRFVDEAKALNRWFDVFCFPVAEGNQAKVAVLFTDITERKRLEAALLGSEAYFRELTQSLPIGVWTSLPSGRDDFINRHWQGYTGLTLERCATSPDAWLDVVHPDDRARIREKSAASRQSGEGYALEVRIREASSGDYRWFLKRSVPVRDAAGRIQKHIGICIDIDDQKRAHYILAAHAGALEAQVQTRTGELRESVGELEAFSYSVSHDMRAPLRAMQGFAQLVLKNHEATLDARSVDHLRRINASAARLDALIGDVLTYSRLLRSEIVLHPIDLDELVRRVIATYPQLQANGAEVSIDGVLPTVLANDASLTQVVSNLLTNAVKFVAPGTKARVRIRADEIDRDIRLSIVDNGIGIALHDQERMWTIFTRIVRAKDYEGTGIGLAIVRKAVERMNGTVGVKSQLGEGSTFWLRLRKG